MKVNINEIIINDNRREVNYEKVKEYAESIKEIGLLNPVTLTNEKKLIAGMHRIEAHKLLGLTEIECNITNLNGLHAELAEIDENLMNNELHYIERGKQLLRRKEIYENLYPETKSVNERGGPGRGNKTTAESAVVLEKQSFVEDTTNKTSKSKRVIHEELQIAKNIIPEVQEVIKEKDINKTDALKIARLKPEQQRKAIEEIIRKPHISNNSGNNEWYTPNEYIETARRVLGIIELDPASCEIANKTIKAKKYYTAEIDGLKQEWIGKTWMNPPYAAELINKFCIKLIQHYSNGDIPEAIILVNNATETAWFNTLIEKASAVIFPKTRVKFRTPTGNNGSPLQGQAVIYFGNKPDDFMTEFENFGWSAYL